MENQKNSKTDYLLSASIIIAALLIAGSLIYIAGVKNIGSNQASIEKSVSDLNAPNVENVKPVGADDHLRGNAEASVKIIEFSDLECPFCKAFHKTMKQVMDEYGQNNKAAWIYRHYPIEQLHSKAKKSAVASECAAELGGNEKFWAYVDRYFEITPSNNGIDLNQLPKIAEDIELDKTQFENCLNSGQYEAKISNQVKDAVNSGSRGTPYSIVIAKNGKKYSIDGALPFEQVKLIIEEALQ